MTVGELREAIQEIPDDAQIDVVADGDDRHMSTQGVSLVGARRNGDIFVLDVVTVQQITTMFS